MSVLIQLCLPLPQQSELNSFLWTIKRDPPSYFFGTIHVPYTRVWDLIPDNSKKAFQQSHIVYFELDLTDPYTISALTSCQLLPHGENLQDVLPHDIYRRLKQHLEYIKLMMPSWLTADQRGKGLYAEGEVQPSKSMDSIWRQMSEMLLPRSILAGDHGVWNSTAAQGASLVKSLTAGRAYAPLSSLVWTWTTSLASPDFCLTVLWILVLSLLAATLEMS